MDDGFFENSRIKWFPIQFFISFNSTIFDGVWWLPWPYMVVERRLLVLPSLDDGCRCWKIKFSNWVLGFYLLIFKIDAIYGVWGPATATSGARGSVAFQVDNNISGHKFLFWFSRFHLSYQDSMPFLAFEGSPPPLMRWGSLSVGL